LDPFGEYTDEAVWTCSAEAHLKQFVSEKLEGGLDFPVRRRGRQSQVSPFTLFTFLSSLSK
jgi:hypothetical protein